MEASGRFCPHNGWSGYLDAHQVLVLTQNTEVGMDAQVNQLAIDGSQSVFSLGLLELSKLPMDRQGFLKGAKRGYGNDDEFKMLEVSRSS